MKQALAPFCFTLLQCSAPSAIRLSIQMGRDERLGGRGGRAKACCDRGSGEDGFCRWVEGTGPRLPRLGARRSNRREERLASSREQWWLGARWTMNASVLRSNKEFSSQLQETNDFGTHGRDFSFSSARLQKKTVTWRFSQIFWRWVKKTHKKDEL
jgi:hypothetical protein